VQLNHSDFERALGGRKIKLSIPQLEINKGRINNLIKNSVLAKDLADVLIDHDITRSYLRTRNITFSLSGTFELQITDHTPETVAETQDQENLVDSTNSMQSKT
jgi:predicted Ser/Thr protein kinase